MKPLLLAAGAASLVLCAAGAEATPTLVLKNLRAEVEIVPEARPDISVVVEANGSSDPPPVVSAAGDRVTVEGNIPTGRQGYRVSLNLDRRMDVVEMKRRSHLARVQRPDLMRIVVHAPMKFKVKSNAYVFGHIGPSETLGVSDNGDGEWRIDPVSGDFSMEGDGGTDFHVATSRTASVGLLGTGNVTLGDTQSLYSGQFGSGDLVASRVSLKSDISISGVGDFEAKYVSGAMDILITDAGSARIEDGDAAKLKVRTIDGLGSVVFGGTVKDADINIGTAAKVRIHKVTGTLAKTTRQQATVDIDTP